MSTLLKPACFTVDVVLDPSCLCCLQVASLQAELQGSSSSGQELERQAQSSQQRQRELERQVEEGERSRQEMQAAAQQGKAAEVQAKALQARLTQATEATASIGQDLAAARSQVPTSLPGNIAASATPVLAAR